MTNYKLTKETKMYNGKTLHRLENNSELFKFSCGWVEKEDNIIGNASIGGDAIVCDNAQVKDIATIEGNAIICDNAIIEGHASVYGNAIIRENAIIRDSASIGGNAQISGNTIIDGNAHIAGDAIISSNNDYIVIQNLNSDYETITFFKSRKGIEVACGIICTIEEFSKSSKAKYGDSASGKTCDLAIELAKLRLSK